MEALPRLELVIGVEGGPMTEKEQVSYRLKFVRGFLAEARQDVDLQRWRSAVDNAQLSVENATKAVLALLGPVSHTRNPATVLLQALSQGSFLFHTLERLITWRLTEYAVL